jgi:hypothetical protein
MGQATYKGIVEWHDDNRPDVAISLYAHASPYWAEVLDKLMGMIDYPGVVVLSLEIKLVGSE